MTTRRPRLRVAGKKHARFVASSRLSSFRHPGAGRDPVLRSAKLALFCFITQVDDKCRQLDTARPRYDDDKNAPLMARAVK